ncbi:MAG: HDIG domain-containing protein [Pirellulales bacterium]|nr:HDIG domain-containing protein [Pirellulales bacterium]
MSTGSKKKRRIERVSSVELPPGILGTLWGNLRRGHVLIRLAMCALTAIALWAMTRGWTYPFAYHLGDVLQRDVVARTKFRKEDPAATEKARAAARQLAVATYDHNPALLEQVRAKLVNDATEIVAAKSLDEVDSLWDTFRLPLAEGTPEPTAAEREQQYRKFHDALAAEGALEKFKAALGEAIQPLAEKGIIDKLPPEHDANNETISIHLVGTESGFPRNVPVSEVLLEGAASTLQKSLAAKMPSQEVADRVFARLRPNLPVTLKLNVEATLAEQKRKAAEVQPLEEVFPVGTVLARARNEEGAQIAIDDVALDKLKLEYQTEQRNRGLAAKASHSLAIVGMYSGLFVLCGFYLFLRDPRVLDDLPRLATLLGLVVVTVAFAMLISNDWRAETVPLILFGMTVAIAYEQGTALLLSACVTLICVIALGHDLAEAIVLQAATVGAILLLGRVRSRSKLLSVGISSAAVAWLTTLGVGTLEGEPMGATLWTACMLALWAVFAGSLMSVMLPMIERVFGVQTDLSLLALGDPAHPLLQELIRRAPGTYNHSITVASLAEAAAEAIGARGLLVRVGAYFHDIGKMLKPGYFVENQGQGDNRHRSLVPAMSTLVIIAHVKDGADLARQSKIPEPIIDFIQQHHGTTLVEYFFRQATESKKADPHGSEVDESSFRYPGPKPQTKEAGILMLADAVESASRVLVEPTPSRIESLVDEISRKRLLDGQFDECGLTLEEVRRIGDSLVKSLTAVYHGRVKYPDQETA